MKLTYKQFANLVLVSAMLGTLLMSGCNLSRPSLTERDMNPDVAVGLWEHVPAAVQAAVGPNEFAVLSDDFSVSKETASFQLLGVQGLRGELVMQKEDGKIAVTATVETHLRKSDLERMLARDVKLRLEQLKEKGWAPLPPGWE